MGIFSSKKTTPAATGMNEPISSILSEDMLITGEIRFKGKTRIDGHIDGDIYGDYLVLSETGKITGDVQISTMICHGTIKGNVTAETFIAQATSIIHGTVTAANLTVESGAALNGEIKAADSKEKKLSQQAVSSSTSPANPQATSKK
ncbi:MAG: polymer-forming cytoskeletal protein [Desulfobulbus sp.]|nr:MAG: polymer-forming cytoskeletal protein [Desulfobulbus sp.]